MDKKRILLSGEATYFESGLARYGREVMNRLHATGKYELAEHATFALCGDVRDKIVPWRLYPNSVVRNDPRWAEFKAQALNTFGAWRFDKVLLDFKPDIVWSFRDGQTMDHEGSSCLRPFYHRVAMPTVDCLKIFDEWISDYINCDGMFGWTPSWSINVLKDNGGGQIKIKGVAPPGVNGKYYFPVRNKKEHKANCGLNHKAFVIGSVIRNQPRKLMPDLIDAFKLFLDKCKTENNTELYKNSYLYLHTSFPDVGWDIPSLIKNTGISHKIIFTYTCRNCKYVTCSCFQDAVGSCPNCTNVSLVLPSISNGISEERLGLIMNLFDIYVQYADSEGFGLPMIEAARCGVPVAAVDYSAMSDVVRTLRGFPIECKLYHKHSSTSHAAIPDNQDCANKLYNYAISPQDIKDKKAKQAHQAVDKNYNWDTTAKTWEDYFDSIKLVGLQGKWNTTPARILKSANNPPDPNNLSNAEFVEWAFRYVYGDISKLYTTFGRKILKELNYGARLDDGNVILAVSREQVVQVLTNLRESQNSYEYIRTNNISLRNEDFIEYSYNRKYA